MHQLDLMIQPRLDGQTLPSMILSINNPILDAMLYDAASKERQTIERLEHEKEELRHLLAMARRPILRLPWKKKR